VSTILFSHSLESSALKEKTIDALLPNAQHRIASSGLTDDSKSKLLSLLSKIE
jgi:hypothetical protein